MTSSGTYNFNLSSSSIILESFDRVGIRPSEITREQIASAIRSLNLELSQMNNNPANLWCVELVTFPLVAGTATYTFDPKYQLVLDSFVRLTQSGSDPIDRLLVSISRDEFSSYPDKTTQGPSTVFWAQRLETMQITLWPVPDGETETSLLCYAMRRIQDVNTTGSQTLDVPLRFLEPVIARLSARLAMKYNKEVYPMLKAEADRVYAEAYIEDQERSALYITPDFGVYQV